MFVLNIVVAFIIIIFNFNIYCLHTVVAFLMNIVFYSCLALNACHEFELATSSSWSQNWYVIKLFEQKKNKTKIKKEHTTI